MGALPAQYIAEVTGLEQPPQSFMLQKPLFICQVSAELSSKLCIHDTSCSSRNGGRELPSQKGRGINKKKTKALREIKFIGQTEWLCPLHFLCIHHMGKGNLKT